MTSTAVMPADEAIMHALEVLFLHGKPVDAGHWQGVPTQGKPDLQTRELLNLQFSCGIPATPQQTIEACMPNMPWAEEEFNERVGRTPRNPHYSLQLWPWWHGQDVHTMEEGQFTHTYSERFWPKRAGEFAGDKSCNPAYGVRYEYGDLDDVLALLQKHPHTRQATLPIFFPEDTGAVHGGRIPCTLHYHFMLRDDSLHIWYPIRSCDAIRHFRDDVYMAMRLCQWVIEQLRVRDNDYDAQELWEGVAPGVLSFTAYSFHAHMGDWHLLEEGLA